MNDPAPALRRRLRQQYRAARRGLSDCEQRSHAKAMRRHFERSPLDRVSAPVGLFVSQDGEPLTQPLIDHCLASQRQVALPCIEPDQRLTFRAYTPKAPLVAGAYGLLEPEQTAHAVPIDSLHSLFMPLVAFAADGQRLGMGGGYYDRLLGSIEPAQRPLLVGLCHGLQHSPSPLPQADWDVPIDAVLTENGWQGFSSRGIAVLGDATNLTPGT